MTIDKTESEKRNRPIGIFDSGIGGLTVVKEVIRELPCEDVIYFGDTARLPYGNKSAQTVIKFSQENTRFLLKYGVKFIIVACNTSSSLALPALREEFRVPILGVVDPAVKKAVEISSKGRIGIIGTRATIASKCYQRQISRLNPRIKSFSQACPLFVPLVEEGWIENEVTLKIIHRYLDPMLKKDIDTLILGCTHYPLLSKAIRRVAGKKINFVDSAKETASELGRMLVQEGLSAETNKQDCPSPLLRCKFFVSDEPERFRKIGRHFLGKGIARKCMQ